MDTSKTNTALLDHSHVKLTDELQERQLIEQFNRQCLEAIAYAREKHPKFADKVSFHNADELDILAHAFRDYAKKDDSVYDILLSEVAEFLAELKRGDYDRAAEEATHVVAVMWRALQGEHANKDDAKAAHRPALKGRNGEKSRAMP